MLIGVGHQLIELVRRNKVMYTVNGESVRGKRNATLLANAKYNEAKRALNITPPMSISRDACKTIAMSIDMQIVDWADIDEPERTVLIKLHREAIVRNAVYAGLAYEMAATLGEQPRMNVFANKQRPEKWYMPRSWRLAIPRYQKYAARVVDNLDTGINHRWSS